MPNSYHMRMFDLWRKASSPLFRATQKGFVSQQVFLCLQLQLCPAWDTGDAEGSRRDKALLCDAGRDTTPCWEPTITDVLMYRAWPSE